MIDIIQWQKRGNDTATIYGPSGVAPSLAGDKLRAALVARFLDELNKLQAHERYVAIDALVQGYESGAPRAQAKAPAGAVRHHVESDEFYAGIDAGIRFAVRVLHADGIETCQSCEGGQGHAYEEPSIDLRADGPHRASGFRALSALADYGLHVRRVELVWDVVDDLPTERIWRIVLRKAHPDRADERPQFVRGCVANVRS